MGVVMPRQSSFQIRPARVNYFMKQPNPEPERILPQSIEAEQAVIGAMMLEKQARKEARSLNANDFYRPDHCLVWETILALEEKGEPIDLVTVSARLQTIQPAIMTSWHGYLIICMNSLPTAAYAGAYANIVKEMAEQRRWLELADFIRESVYDPWQMHEDKRAAIRSRCSSLFGKRTAKELEVPATSTQTKVTV